MMVPILAEETLEYGIRHALSTQLRQLLSLRVLYTLFLERTRASYFDRALQLGEARRVNTK